MMVLPLFLLLLLPKLMGQMDPETQKVIKISYYYPRATSSGITQYDWSIYSPSFFIINLWAITYFLLGNVC